MREKVFAFLAVIGLAHVVFAQVRREGTVNLYITTVNATPTGGTWQVYLQDSDDNDGLANYDIDVLGGGGAATAHSPATIEAPRPNDISDQYADASGGRMGFNTNVSAGAGNANGTDRDDIIAGQNTVYAGADSDDPTFDMGILVGVGQESSSASPQNGTQGPTDGSGTPTGIPTPVWSYTPFTTVSGGAGAPSYQIAGTLIEQGTYSTANRQGSLTVRVDSFVELLGTQDNGMNEPWTYLSQDATDTPVATVISDTISLIPEPASLSMLGISIGTMIFARPRGGRPPTT